MALLIKVYNELLVGFLVFFQDPKLYTSAFGKSSFKLNSYNDK